MRADIPNDALLKNSIEPKKSFITLNMDIFFLSSGFGADENQSGKADGKRGDLYRLYLLLEQQDAGYREGDYTAADHHGVTHPSETVVSHDIHAGIKEGVGKKEIEELQACDIFPERDVAQIVSDLLFALRSHPHHAIHQCCHQYS